MGKVAQQLKAPVGSSLSPILPPEFNDGTAGETSEEIFNRMLKNTPEGKGGSFTRTTTPNAEIINEYNREILKSNLRAYQEYLNESAVAGEWNDEGRLIQEQSPFIGTKRSGPVYTPFGVYNSAAPVVTTKPTYEPYLVPETATETINVQHRHKPGGGGGGPNAKKQTWFLPAWDMLNRQLISKNYNNVVLSNTAAFAPAEQLAPALDDSIGNLIDKTKYLNYTKSITDSSTGQSKKISSFRAMAHDWFDGNNVFWDKNGVSKDGCFKRGPDGFPQADADKFLIKSNGRVAHDVMYEYNGKIEYIVAYAQNAYGIAGEPADIKQEIKKQIQAKYPSADIRDIQPKLDQSVVAKSLSLMESAISGRLGSTQAVLKYFSNIGKLSKGNWELDDNGYAKQLIQLVSSRIFTKSLYNQ